MPYTLRIGADSEPQKTYPSLRHSAATGKVSVTSIPLAAIRLLGFDEALFAAVMFC